MFGVQCPWRRRREVGEHLLEEIVVGSCIKVDLLLIVTTIVVVKERVIVSALHFSTTRLHEITVISLDQREEKRREEKKRGFKL